MNPDLSKADSVLSWSVIAALCVSAALLVTIPYAAIAALAALVLIALHSPQAAFLAALASAVIKCMNYSQIDSDPMFTLLAWGVLLIASPRILLSREWVHRTWAPLCVLAFGGFVLALSVLSSQRPVASSAKVILFMIGASGLVAGAAELRKHDTLRVYHSDVILGVCFAMIIWVSAPGLIFREWGFARNGTGFQGMFNHPQAFGVLVAPLVAWRLGLMVEGVSSRKWGELLIVLAGLYYLYESRSRTAVGAVGIAISVVLLVGMIWRRDWMRAFGQSFGVTTMKGQITVMCIAAILSFPGLFLSGILDFIAKGNTENAGLIETLESSRGRLIEIGWSNFIENPVTGIGFGISSTPMRFAPDEFLGIPLGAPIEKGNQFVAILEEIGILGALPCAVLLALLLWRLLRYGRLSYAALAITALMVNMGEAILFSMGGTGMMIWVYLALAIAEVRDSAPLRSNSGQVRYANTLRR